MIKFLKNSFNIISNNYCSINKWCRWRIFDFRTKGRCLTGMPWCTDSNLRYKVWPYKANYWVFNKCKWTKFNQITGSVPSIRFIILAMALLRVNKNNRMPLHLVLFKMECKKYMITWKSRIAKSKIYKGKSVKLIWPYSPKKANYNQEFNKLANNSNNKLIIHKIRWVGSCLIEKLDHTTLLSNRKLKYKMQIRRHRLLKINMEILIKFRFHKVKPVQTNKVQISLFHWKLLTAVVVLLINSAIKTSKACRCKILLSICNHLW